MKNSDFGIIIASFLGALGLFVPAFAFASFSSDTRVPFGPVYPASTVITYTTGYVADDGAQSVDFELVDELGGITVIGCADVSGGSQTITATSTAVADGHSYKLQYGADTTGTTCASPSVFTDANVYANQFPWFSSITVSTSTNSGSTTPTNTSLTTADILLWATLWIGTFLAVVGGMMML